MKLSRRGAVALAAAGALFLCGALWATAQSAAAQALPARSSDADGVRVVVKPRSVPAAAVWEFEVVMDTHTKPLDDDLTKMAVLVDNGGRLYAPLAWQGDKPGGHHRKGILRFPAPAEPVKSFELRIQGLGGVKTRVFQWIR